MSNSAQRYSGHSAILFYSTMMILFVLKWLNNWLLPLNERVVMLVNRGDLK